jgi:predicted transcriptional regulator/predicted nucleotidyltransferase
MRIARGQLIGGVPAIKVRDALLRHNWVNAEAIVRRCRVNEDVAKNVISELLRLDYIEANDDGYGLTEAGAQFTNATASAPIQREKADRIVRELVQRAKIVNRGSFAFKVLSVVVFGSYLDDAATIGDVDIATELAPTHKDKKKQEKLEKLRLDTALEEGRRFGNFLDQLYWPEHEVQLLLKARVAGLSLHPFDELPGLRARNQTLKYRVLIGDVREITRKMALSP